MEFDSPELTATQLEKQTRFLRNFFEVANRARLALRLNGRDACKCAAIALRRDSKTRLDEREPECELQHGKNLISPIPRGCETTT